MAIFEELKVGDRVEDEDGDRGTVETIYIHSPLTGAIILWDRGVKSWPTDHQINGRLKIVKIDSENDKN